MGMREVRFTQAARKHRVSNGRARQVINDPLVTLTFPAPEPGMDDRIVFIGDDNSGRALEVIAVDLPEYLLVIHVQDLQAKFRPYYDRATEGGVMGEPQYIYGADIDLDHEDVRDSHGNRVTSDYVEKALDDVLDENIPVHPAEVTTRPGRPSLTGGSAHSPQVTFRLPEQLHREAVDAAEREGTTVSALAREALERYLRQL